MTATLAVLALLPTTTPDCFPIERLPASLRPRAEALLLKILDGEGLYTLVGGLKPMSSGWLSLRFNVDAPDLAAAEKERQVLSALRCGDEIFANLQPFWRVYEGQRYLDGVIYHRGAFRRTIEAHSRFFAFYGVSPSSHPVEATMAFEVDATAQRNRGYGYLFGYPDHAVDFFVNSEAEQRKTKKLVPRDFLHIPTFGANEGRFVYAVPKGQPANASDLALRERAKPILAYYRRLRPRFIGAGKPGVVALLRTWFSDGNQGFSSEAALRKAMTGIGSKAG